MAAGWMWMWTSLVATTLGAVASCGRVGFELVDRELPHVELAPGWTIHVFRDLAPDFRYEAMDFVDGPNTFGEFETYDNQPRWLFTIRPPYVSGLGVVAGRQLIELDEARYVDHDYGGHPPNGNTLPDEITSAVWVADLEGRGPRIVLTSGSLTGGDGVYAVDASWSVTRESALNNTRCTAWDPLGVVAGGGPVGYVGNLGGVFIHPDTTTRVLAGHTTSMRVVGDDLLRVRYTADARAYLVRVATIVPLAEVELLGPRTSIVIGEGDPPAPSVAWVLLDASTLAAMSDAGELQTIATHRDPDVHWHGVTAPPPGHPLAGSTYLIESNRTRGVDRVLALTPP